MVWGKPCIGPTKGKPYGRGWVSRPRKVRAEFPNDQGSGEPIQLRVEVEEQGSNRPLEPENDDMEILEEWGAGLLRDDNQKKGDPMRISCEIEAVSREGPQKGRASPEDSMGEKDDVELSFG